MESNSAFCTRIFATYSFYGEWGGGEVQQQREIKSRSFQIRANDYEMNIFQGCGSLEFYDDSVFDKKI